MMDEMHRFKLDPGRPMPNKGVMDVEAYVPGTSTIDGQTKIYKLSSNESPFGPPPAAIEAYKQAIEKMALYPDGQAERLRHALAQAHVLKMDNILCGNGSDELLGLLAHNYLNDGDEVIMTEHGFSVYEIQSRSAGATIIKVKEKGCRIDIEAVRAALTSQTKLVFIANPGNPTGTYLTQDEVRRLHRTLPGNVLLVLDSAYAEFVDAADYEPGIALVEAHDNVVMTRTFSKIYGLAGLRIGWMYAPDGVIQAIERVRPPFNVGLPAQLAAAKACQDHDFIAKVREFNTKWRAWLTRELEKIGLRVSPSVANFLLIHFHDDRPDMARQADAHLRSCGFILRLVGGYGFPNALRLTIGCEEANRGVIAALTDFMKLHD